MLKATLHIELHEDEAGKAQLRMQGPLTERLLCYGMLEMAKDVVRAQKEGGQLVALPPPAAVPLNLRRG